MMFNKNPTIKISPEQDDCVIGWKSINDQLAAAVNNLKKTKTLVLWLSAIRGVIWRRLNMN